MKSYSIKHTVRENVNKRLNAYTRAKKQTHARIGLFTKMKLNELRHICEIVTNLVVWCKKEKQKRTVQIVDDNNGEYMAKYLWYFINEK